MVKRRTVIKDELDGQSKNLSWEDMTEQFLNNMKIRGLAYHTMRWHGENLKAVLKALRLKELPTNPAMVTESMLKDVILKMINDGLSPNTVNHRVRTLKQFYDFLIDEKLVANNPTVKLDRKKSKGMIIQAFTEQQLTALLSIPNKNRFVGLRDYAIMLIFLDTGIRLSELVSIELQHVKMADSEIVIPHGKGDKFRRVFVSSRTRDTLRKYIKARGDIPGNQYLFVNFENQHMKGRNVQERLTIYGKKARLEGVRVSPHTFRHTFSKLYIMRGGDPFSLQALLGHSTLDMVRHYVNLWGSDLQKMHRKFSPVDNLNRPIFDV
ncbi:MAG: Tyrosine recombinase XerD [Pelotomaculum sp. PtaU1.Bin035]|nr:MAG: Tyrosine recombinase XerD [Pelotomaculum sp. PtaU1.Bin035]